MNPRDEVAFYQLAQAIGRSVSEAEQQAALAAFTRLRDDKARQREAAALKPDRAGVTPQVIDAAGAPPK